MRSKLGGELQKPLADLVEPVQVRDLGKRTQELLTDDTMRDHELLLCLGLLGLRTVALIVQEGGR
jgi:hypothetical protein